MNYNILNHISSFLTKYEIWKAIDKYQVDFCMPAINNKINSQVYQYLRNNKKVLLSLDYSSSNLNANPKCKIFADDKYHVSLGLLSDNEFQFEIPDTFIEFGMCKLSIWIGTLYKSWSIDLDKILSKLNNNKKYLIWSTPTEDQFSFRIYFRLVNGKYQISHPWITFNKFFIINLQG